MKKKYFNIGLVCTRGGHFEQLTNLSEFYERYNHFWITNRHKQTESHLKSERRYYIDPAHFKKPWTYIGHVPPIIKIFSKEKPTHVISTGSGRTALVPFLYCKLNGIKFLHIDTFSRVHGYSKFGTFLLKTGYPIFTQWEDPANKKAIYVGPIFKNQNVPGKRPDSKTVFVTVGTRDEPFTRLLKAVEDLVKTGVIKEKVIVQAGHTKFQSEQLDIFDFCDAEKIDELIMNAKYVITQESAGIGTKCLKFNTKFIVMPRDYQYDELPTKSDMNEDLHWKLEEMGYTKVVNNVSELRTAIEQTDKLKSGFKFDNSLAIETLKKALEDE